MRARITFLEDNTVSIRGVGEHGFAAFLETGKGNFLFDTESGEGLISNLMKFDKGPLSFQKIILSHGYHDHTGGPASILEFSGGVEVLAHPDLFSIRYRICQKDGREVSRFVGLKFPGAYLESLGGRFILEKNLCEVTREMFLTGEVPRKISFEKGDPKLFAMSGERLILDPILG